MLDNFSNGYFDAHIHLVQCAKNENLIDVFTQFQENYCGITCAHEKDEFFLQEKLINELESNFKNVHFFKSFGMHPQLPLIKNADFLENLLKKNKIDAIGEAGFDFYTDEFKKNAKQQQTAWQIQLDFSIKYQKPLIIHSRKALNLIFRDTNKLKKTPEVLFHSFAGSLVEAKSLLNRGINAFFSFGKQIKNGNKKAIECVSLLSKNVLRLETDAPFQTLKGENFTSLADIKTVYETAKKLRTQ